MKKATFFTVLLTVLSLLLCSCGANSVQTDETTSEEAAAQTTETAAQTPEPDADRPVINAGFLKGPTGMGAAYLYENNENGTSKAAYNLITEGAADVLQAKLISGEVDLAALPVNVAAVLNAKTERKIRMLAVNTLGVLYILSSSDEVRSAADLKDRTILASGQGTTVEYVLDYILEKNGLIPGQDVTVEFASEHSETVTKAMTGQYDVILLPEPFVTQLTMQDAGFETVIDLTMEWEKLGGGLLTMGAIAVRSEFAEEHPEAVEAFLADYEASVNAVTENNKDAAALIEKYGIAKAAVAEKALPNCMLTFMTGEDMKENVSEYLSVLFDRAPQAVGGKLPGDDFYYMPALPDAE